MRLAANVEMWYNAGGAFDPLGLASADDSKAFRLKTAEIKHGRLAMIAFLGELSHTPLSFVFFWEGWISITQVQR